ncbi:MAG: tRNA (guanosine(46)-N7)-methyltransferase TrmB [Oscillospiraceae bacterium]|nr:tRNA (guanosine(46)-N7)-methyltransferase TrmB [Oscillospiraceae bacterium]
MRKKKNLAERVFACSGLLICKLYNTGEEPEAKLLDFCKIYGNSDPVWLEIGCGKGGFVNQAAKIYPHINFLAAEKIENVAVSALERTKLEKIPNIRYITGMAEYLGHVIAPNSVKRIYLNFSCPFPKERHAKHRLTHPAHLEIYKRILTANGLIIFKTDNRSFFEYSQESLSSCGFHIQNVTHDLHNSGITGNIITEYEKIFTKQGQKINYLEAIVDKQAISCYTKSDKI